jgi:hypothetical protein
LIEFLQPRSLWQSKKQNQKELLHLTENEYEIYGKQSKIRRPCKSNLTAQELGLDSLLSN